MKRRAHTHLALRIALCFGAVVASGASGAASGAPTPAVPGAVAPLTPVTEIGPQAEQVAVRLRAMSEAVSDVGAFARLEDDVGRVSRRAAERWDEAASALDGTPRRAALDALEGAWNALRVEFARLGDDLTGRVQRREADLATLAALHESWSASRERAREADAPAPVLERIDATLAAIAATHDVVERRRNRVLVLQDTVSRALQASDDSLTRIEGARRDAVRRACSRCCARSRAAIRAWRAGPRRRRCWSGSPGASSSSSCGPGRTSRTGCRCAATSPSPCTPR